MKSYRDWHYNNIRGAVAIVLGLAAALRLWGISFGMPYDFNPDEVHEILRALKLGNGEYSLSPWKGGLYLILFLLYGALYVIWRILGMVSNPEEFALAYLSDPTTFFIIGRVTVALIGTLTCFVVYKITEKIFDHRTGIIACLFIALSLYHVIWSHYINVDIGMIFFVYLSFYLLLCFKESLNSAFVIGSGVAAGVAFAFKLPGLLAVLVFLCFFICDLKRLPESRLTFKLFCLFFFPFILTSAVMAPENYIYAYTALGIFENLLAGLVTSADRVDPTNIQTQIDSVTIDIGSAYYSIMLRGYNLPITILSVVGLWASIKGKQNAVFGLLLGCGIYVMGLILADRPGSQRYLLPIFPLLAILSAYGAVKIATTTKIHIGLVTGVVCGLLAIPTLYEVFMLTRPDTRVIAKSYIEDNVPANSRILIDGMRHRMIHSPPINPNSESLERWVNAIEKVGSDVSRGVSRDTLSLVIKSKTDLSGPTYDLHSTMWGLGVKDLNYYVCEAFDFVVLSGTIAQKYRDPFARLTWPVSAEFYRGIRVDERFVLEKVVNPSPWTRRGPSIEIYRVNGDCKM